MILNELFDRAAPVTWVVKSPTTWRGQFTVGEVPFEIYISATGPKAWACSFAIEPRFAAQNNVFDSFGNSGLSGRSSLAVFSTVIAVFSAFLRSKKPKTMTFTGAKYYNKNGMYAKMLKAKMGDLPYQVEIRDEGPEVEFVLTRRPQIQAPTFSPAAAGNPPPTA